MRLRFTVVIAAAILGGLTLIAPSATAATGDCDFSGWQSQCSVSNSGSQVDIGASTTVPGGGGQQPPGGPSSPTSPPAVVPEPEDCPLDRCDLSYDVVAPPDVTLADLASFRPARPTLGGEPAGFGVVGMPTNFVAAASEERIPGTLLGWDVTVRFVPAGFVFDYGDGAIARSADGGTSWQRLGQAQFTPTPTSHVYGARGTYPVSVTVEYAASVDFGSGVWRPVAGYVIATAGGYSVRVVEARTALVDQTCLEDPRGPGC